MLSQPSEAHPDEPDLLPGVWGSKFGSRGSEFGYPLGVMDIVRNSAQSRFETNKDGETAIASYEMDGAQMTVTHVVVPPPIEGQGVASALAKFAIQTARDEGLTIVPQCPFMAAYFRRHPDQSDILAD